MALKRLQLVIVIVAAVAAVAYVAWPASAPTPTSMQTTTIGGRQFTLLAADTEASRELGLGQRDSLPQNEAMLFAFDAPGNWGIWMKDMRFPLDILWLRQDGTVTTIARNVATSTYPQVYYPRTPDASYVIETNAGGAAGVAEGDKVVL